MTFTAANLTFHPIDPPEGARAAYRCDATGIDAIVFDDPPTRGMAVALKLYPHRPGPAPAPLALGQVDDHAAVSLAILNAHEIIRVHGDPGGWRAALGG